MPLEKTEMGEGEGGWRFVWERVDVCGRKKRDGRKVKAEARRGKGKKKIGFEVVPKAG